MNAFLLKLLDLFQILYRLLGANYAQLRAIVEVKLIMDNRRQVMSYRKKDNQEPGNTILWTMFFYTLFGAFIALGLYSVSSLMLSMVMLFSYIMVMVMMTLVTDFSSILLDTSDNTIILPRPVDGRTLFLARITHIFLYLGQITIGLLAFPALVILLKYGIVMLILFIAATVLVVITAMFTTNAIYLLILQFASEEKLKNVINYFQIIMGVLIMGGSQVLPRLAGRFDLDDYVFEIQWWGYLIPPVWMGAALESYYYKLTDIPHLTLTVFAVIVPPLGFYLVNKFLTPVFGRKLGVIGTEARTVKTKTEKTSIISSISKWLTTSSLERGTFELIYHIVGRDRKIKLRVYPSIGYVIIFGAIFMFRDRGDFMTAWNSLPDTQYHLLLLYLAFMILQVAIHEIPYSDDFKASWIYFSSPLEKPGEILTGTLKAILIRFFIPGYALISLLVLIISGWTALDDIAFGLFNNILMVLAVVLISKRSLPLSMAPNVRSQSGSFIRSLIMILLVGSLGLVHYLLAKNPLFLLSAIPVQALVIYFLYTLYRKTSWDQITL
jgi:hypothetical protein